MHKIEYKILNLFKKNPFTELSTSDIVRRLFPTEMRQIDTVLESRMSDKKKLQQAKQKRGKLHRQILHHLNKLVKEDIISLSREGSHGVKYFVPNLSEGEELIIGKQKRKIMISKPQMPAVPIEGYEQRGIIKRYEGDTWVERINSLLIECTNFNSLEELHKTIIACFGNINDTICLNNFEHVSRYYKSTELHDFIGSITKECEDYGKNLSIIIDFSHQKDEKKLVSVLRHYFEKFDSKHVRWIFDLDSRQLMKNTAFVTACIETFSHYKANMYFKNKALSKSPHFVGAAGPYTFDEDEWELYEKEYQKNIKGIACSQTAVAIDVKKMFNKDKKLTNMPELLINIAKTLLAVNSIQRTRSLDYFKSIISMNKSLEKESFLFSSNYIRFWNYGWKEENIDIYSVIEAIQEAKKEVDTFCKSQETIYLSCGIPTRFKILFSCAFKRFGDNILGGEKYYRTIIRRLEDLYSDETKETLLPKEKIFELFDGGDRIRFFRNGDIRPKDIEREISIILNTWRLPFFCYDFGGIHGNLKLTTFIGE